jgi:tetratricopeptide (TPR) repeat protein
LAATRYYLGGTHQRQGRKDAAEEAFVAALELYETLVARHEDVPEYRWRLATTCFALADLLRLSAPRQGGARRKEAGEAYRRALELVKDLERDHPGVPRYRGLLGDTVRMLALVHKAENDWEGLEALYEEGLRIVPTDAGTYVDLAIHLATCRDETRRDLPRAIAVAEKSTQLAPHGYECWAALGIARYRSEDHAGAVEALEKATSLGSVVPSHGPLSRGSEHFRCWFYLAMAKWQAGEKDQARACFARGVDAIERNFPKRPKHRRRKLRVEAAALLGIHDD